MDIYCTTEHCPCMGIKQFSAGKAIRCTAESCKNKSEPSCGSAFFSEWAEKHTESFTMEIFSIIGFPVILWCIALIAYNVLQKNGVLV